MAVPERRDGEDKLPGESRFWGVEENQGTRALSR